MSKKPEKITIDFSQNQLLDEMNLPGLMSLYRRYANWEKKFETIAGKWKLKKDSIGASLQVVVSAVGADVVTYRNRHVTLVRPESAPALNEDRLRENLMLVGKLTAEQVQTIFKISMDPAKSKKPYVRLGKNEQTSKGQN